MNNSANQLIKPPKGYNDWLAELKTKIHNTQQLATLVVNNELILLYWHIGSEILARQAQQGWWAKIIERLAYDLRNLFSNMKGFSPRNLKYMRTFADTWQKFEFVQVALAKLSWGHIL